MLGHGAVGELALGQIPFSTGGVIEVNVSDTLTPLVVDAAAYIVLLDRVDTLPVLLTDAMGTIQGTLARTETLLPRADDTLAILAALERSDTLLLRADDALVILGILERSDTLTPALSESLALPGVLVPTDTLALVVTEALTLLTSLSHSETLAVRVDDYLTVERRRPSRSAVGTLGSSEMRGGLRAARPLGGFATGGASGNIRH